MSISGIDTRIKNFGWAKKTKLQHFKLFNSFFTIDCFFTMLWVKNEYKSTILVWTVIMHVYNNPHLFDLLLVPRTQHFFFSKIFCNNFTKVSFSIRKRSACIPPLKQRAFSNNRLVQGWHDLGSSSNLSQPSRNILYGSKTFVRDRDLLL